MGAWSKLPFATQRSDSWTLPDTYAAYVGKASINPAGQLERSEVGELRRALMAADLERRVYEAKAFLKEQEEVN